MSSLMAILPLFSFPGILFTRIVKDGGVIAVNDCIDTNNNTPGFCTRCALVVIFTNVTALIYTGG